MLVVGYEVFTLNYDLLVGFGQDLEPVPGFAESWTRPTTALTWTRSRSATGMKWSDGEPATSEDARWTLQLILDAIASRGRLPRPRLPRAVRLTNAGVTAVDRARPETLVVTTDRPNDQILKTYVPILPKHIWESVTAGDDRADFTERAAGRRHRPVPGRRVGDRAVRPVRAQPELLERIRAAADEVIIQIFASADTMVQALAPARSTTPAASMSDQFDALKTDEDIVTVDGTANGCTELAFNTYGTGTGKTIEGGGPSTTALLDSRSATRSATRSTSELLVERVLGGYGERRHDERPAVPGELARRARRPRGRSTSRWPSRSSTPPATSSTRRQAARQGRQADQPQPGHARTRSDVSGRRPVHQGLVGELGITVNPTSSTADTLIDHDAAARGRRPASTRPTTTCSSGAGAATSIRTRCSRSSPATRSAASTDSFYCNPALRRAVRRQQNVATDAEERKALIAEMQEICLRRGPVPHPVLRRRSSTPTGPTGSRAGRTSRPTTARRCSATGRSATRSCSWPVAEPSAGALAGAHRAAATSGAAGHGRADARRRPGHRRQTRRRSWSAIGALVAGRRRRAGPHAGGARVGRRGGVADE